MGEKNSETGDIYVCTWGYNMTNVDFYQVVRCTGRSVYLQKLETEKIPNGFLTGHMTPIRDRFVSDEFRKVLGEDRSIRLKSYAKASLWDGKPTYYNHCD
jgi:hypothetical protein